MYDGQLYSNIAVVTIEITPRPRPGCLEPRQQHRARWRPGLEWTGLTPRPRRCRREWSDRLARSLDGPRPDELLPAWRNDGNVSLSWGYAAFADTDGNAATGFSDGGYLPVGADYLLEGTRSTATPATVRTGAGPSWAA
ncbi:MAG: hypothetical protein R3F17_14460 [Planctomycetota bacterium]